MSDDFIVGRVNLNGGDEGEAKPVVEMPVDTTKGRSDGELVLLKVLGISNGRYVDLQQAAEKVQDNCRKTACSSPVFRDEFCKVHYYQHKLAQEAFEKYPKPLGYLLAGLIQKNVEEWIGEKPETNGAEQVRETGLTTNQQEWVGEIVDALGEVQNNEGDRNR